MKTVKAFSEVQRGLLRRDALIRSLLGNLDEMVCGKRIQRLHLKALHGFYSTQYEALVSRELNSKGAQQRRKK